MSIKAKLAAVGVVAVAAVGSLTFAGPASADTLSSSDEAHFREVWSQYGVASDVQDKLVTEFETTGEWDSLTDAKPVSTREITSAGKTETVSTFAGGSITVAGNRTAPAVTPSGVHINAAIDQCKTLSSSHYDYTRQCRVWTNVVVATFAYNVTYYQVQGGNSKIKSKPGITASCYGGGCSNQKVVILRATQSGARAAQVQGSLTWTSYANATSRDYWLLFSAKGSSTSASNN